jgi:hypothetical protein
MGSVVGILVRYVFRNNMLEKKHEFKMLCEKLLMRRMR